MPPEQQESVAVAALSEKELQKQLLKFYKRHKKAGADGPAKTKKCAHERCCYMRLLYILLWFRCSAVHSTTLAVVFAPSKPNATTAASDPANARSGT